MRRALYESSQTTAPDARVYPLPTPAVAMGFGCLGGSRHKLTPGISQAHGTTLASRSGEATVWIECWIPGSPNRHAGEIPYRLLSVTPVAIPLIAVSKASAA